MSSPDLAPGQGIVRANGTRKGCAFVLTSDVVLTAAHVVEKATSVEYETYDGRRYPASITAIDKGLDIASMSVRGIGRSPFHWAHAITDMRWIVTAQPLPDDPQLCGSVTSPDRLITNKGGVRVQLVQLEVATRVGTFGGYSGSCVLAARDRSEIIGVLVEQAKWRTRNAQLDTNVVYAVPIASAMDRLGLLGQAFTVPQGAVERRVLEDLCERYPMRADVRDTTGEKPAREALGFGLSETLATLNELSPSRRLQALDNADRTLSRLLDLPLQGPIARSRNLRMSSACRFGLYIVSATRGDNAKADEHRLWCYSIAPREARKTYFPYHFKKVLAPHASDLYRDYSDARAAIDPSSRRLRILARAGAGALAVGGLAAMIHPATRTLGVRMMQIGGVVAVNAERTDYASYSLTELTEDYQRRMDERVKQVAERMLEGPASEVPDAELPSDLLDLL